MKTSRRTNSSAARLLLAVGTVCLFVTAMAGFASIHEHDREAGTSSHQCAVCLTHATASAAVVADGQVVVADFSQPATTFVAAADDFTPITLLTEEIRGPPSLL